MKRRAFTVALTVLAQAQGAADPLLVIRQNYQAVNAAIAAGKFKASRKNFGYCGPARNSERTLWTDGRGIPRKYVETGGSDDSAVTLSSYLNAQGKVNFVLIERNDVHGQSDTLRLYYNDAGQLFRRLASSSWALEWESWVTRDVRRAFGAASPCAS